MFRTGFVVVLAALSGVAASTDSARAQSATESTIEAVLAEAIRFAAGDEYEQRTNPVLVREHTGVLQGKAVLPVTDAVAASLGSALSLTVRSEQQVRTCEGRQCRHLDTDFAVWAYVESIDSTSAVVTVVKEQSLPAIRTISGATATVRLERNALGTWRAVRILKTGVT